VVEVPMRSRIAPVGIFWLVCLVFAAVPGALTQNTSGIFITPVPDAPFTGVITVDRTIVRPDGKVENLKTIRDTARDSRGRIYNVFRVLVPATFTGTPPTIRVHFYDPQTRNYTYLYPDQHTYTTGTVTHPPAATPADLIASPAGNSTPLNQFTKQEDLGTQSVGGVSAHGVRETQTIPAASSSTGNEIVLTDEYWYSDDLHMNVMVKHSDPRTGSVTMTLTQATRTDPDPSLFQIPEGYQPAGSALARAQ
jgi:hypothetical protein